MYKALLALFLFSVTTFAKTFCSIPVSSASGEWSFNSEINTRFKKHQKLNWVQLEVNLENLSDKDNRDVKVIFVTEQDRKFEVVFEMYSEALMIWKSNFGKSRAFPQILKNYMNISRYNSGYLLRLYDSPTEKSKLDLGFSATQCSESSMHKLAQTRGAVDSNKK